MAHPLYDLCIIGGGVNGAGIAADAAGRGLCVLLCEQQDLAGATSSASTKLIHGGLRYLEQKEFKLVRHALKEREVLLKLAPHLIEELRFILPHEKHHRPAWLVTLGLFLYDHLAKRKKLQGSRSLLIKKTLYQDYLNPAIKKAFVYSDCRVDDARLVVVNALQAKQSGATILNYHCCTNVSFTKDRWQISIQNKLTQETMQIEAKCLVNATGPWAASFCNETLQAQSHYSMKLVQGSHVVVPKLHPGKDAFILQTQDNRIVFVIPYQEEFSLIGTTDTHFTGDLFHPALLEKETTYLLEVVGQYFNCRLTADDIIWHYSGVRPLISKHNEPLSEISRDYLLELLSEHHPPLLNVFSGKITTYRKLAEEAVDLFSPFFKNLSKSQTKETLLPGGHFHLASEYLITLEKQFPYLPKKLAKRYLHTYGSDTPVLLKDCTCLNDLGTHFGAGLYQKEVDYLIEHEWAKTAEDIIWRRTKLGLFLTPNEIKLLSEYTGSPLREDDGRG